YLNKKNPQQLLVHSLSALPATAQDNTDSWSADEACAAQTKSTFIENQSDSTCATFIYCYTTNGSSYALVKSCKAGQYFDATLKFCTSEKPEKCA
ncbi:hypothetical protein KR018_001330, partial [Drosophila ironensis]